jgi:ubiquinone/menaquinone biosynthesis C-methylase UbiE
MNEQEKYKEIYAGATGKNYEQRHGEGYGRGFWGEGIVEYFKTLNPKSVLDVGCGYGRFCDAATEFVETVYGADIGSVATGNVIKNDKINFIDAEAKSIPLSDNSVEWVTSFDCLEHCLPEDIDTILNEFNRVATKGFIFSISYTPDSHLDLNLHMTVQQEGWWIEKIQKYGKIKREGNIRTVDYSYIICEKQ